jgi:hypothetical protein
MPPGLRRLGELSQWPVQTQQGARRNALIASTALADRRRQRREVDDFLSELDRVPRQRPAG